MPDATAGQPDAPPFCVALEQLNRSPTPLAGGKAANLGELLRAWVAPLTDPG